ncbi:MAG: hypothetical protein R3321_00420 [Nitrososphaeraceae archaeon]|nr:hypothetical protein [Nitrososphaeraceae archaeon]
MAIEHVVALVSVIYGAILGFLATTISEHGEELFYFIMGFILGVIVIWLIYGFVIFAQYLMEI